MVISEDLWHSLGEVVPPFLEWIWVRWHCLSGDKRANGCHYYPFPLNIGAEMASGGRKPGHWLFAALYSRLYAPVLWCYCPSGTNLHQCQGSKTLPHAQVPTTPGLPWIDPQVHFTARQADGLNTDRVKATICETPGTHEGRLFTLPGRLPGQQQVQTTPWGGESRLAPFLSPTPQCKQTSVSNTVSTLAA